MDPGAGEGVGLPRSAFLYWDLSCLEHADCGTWMCASGYCAEPGRIGPFAEAPPNTDVGGTGTPCLADLDCGAGLDCRYPGYCHEGIADTPFFVSEIPFDRSAATYPDGSCNVDADCPGRPCVDGWCIAPEYAGFAPPRRGDLNYYDGSCTADADCGPWVCVQSWCRDPARVGADHGVPGDTSQAARARAAGVWQSDAAELAEWVEIDTQAHGLGVAEVSTSADVGDKWGLGYGYGASALSTLGSGAGYGTALGSLSGSGFGAGGYGLGGIGTIGGLGTGGTYCSSNADCPTGDACVYPGECRAGAGSEPFTTANIAFSATPGDACSTDDDCGPMYCRSSVCTPVEDVEASMPPRSDIYWNDGSCDSPDDCGSWVCAGLWCRPR